MNNHHIATSTGRICVGLALSLLAVLSGQVLAEAVPRFQSVQAEEFALAGSISNAWADFDADGDLDLAVSLKSGEVRLYRNDDGTLVSVGQALGLPGEGAHEIRGLSWGDYDGDGFPDLLGGSNVRPLEDNRSYVWKNHGGERFEEVAQAVGLTIPNRISRQANWIDYDGDGLLDLYAADRVGINQLFRNTGDSFVPVFEGQGPNDPRATVGACWFDFDQDGDLDLFLANQSGAADALWRNDGDRFVDVAPALGLDSPGRADSEGGVGCAVGDYDNDGHLDLFVVAYGPNLLFRNNGDGTFVEVGKALGLARDGHAVGAAWGDYDNDGFIDLFVTSYEGPFGEQVPVNLLYRNEQGRSFTQVLEREDLLNAGDHGVEWIDYDGDGAIDLSLTDGYGPEGGHFLFRNLLDEDARKRSLSVYVTTPDGRSGVPGAEVRLYDAGGAVLATRMVSTGGGYNAQSITPVHFGLAREYKDLTVEVAHGVGGVRKVIYVTGVDPSDYRGRSLIVPVER